MWLKNNFVKYLSNIFNYSLDKSLISGILEQIFTSKCFENVRHKAMTQGHTKIGHRYMNIAKFPCSLKTALSQFVINVAFCNNCRILQ